MFNYKQQYCLKLTLLPSRVVVMKVGIIRLLQLSRQRNCHNTEVPLKPSIEIILKGMDQRIPDNYRVSANNKNIQSSESEDYSIIRDNFTFVVQPNSTNVL